nr:retrovirus-related Pol polyprotein from transposon TNT 1-94 [Tanacetum cinerariifolium]
MHNSIMAAGSRDRPSMLLRKCGKLSKGYNKVNPQYSRCKEIAKPITPPSKSASKEDNDPEQTRRDKDMQKNLALIAKYFKKIYKPTNNNLRTSSNSRNKNMDMTPWYKNENQSRQFRNQRTMNVAGARENELEAHYSCMAKIQEVPTADTDNDSEPLEKVQNDTGYNVFTDDLQHSEQSESISNTCIVETDDSNVIPDLPDICDDDIQNDQNDVESDDERVALANFIANLKLDTEFKKYKAFNDRTIDYDKIKRKLNETLGKLVQKDIEIKEDALAELQCLYLHKVKECDCLAQKLSKQTESVSNEVHAELLQHFAKIEKHLISLEIALQKYLKAQLQDKNIAISELKKLIEKGKGKSVETKFDKPSVVRQPNAQRIPKPSVLVDSDHFAYVTKMLNDVNARTKKPNVVPISTRKPKGHANKSVATPHKKKVASKSTNQKPKSYYRMLYEKTSKAWKWWIEQQCPSGYKWVPKTKMQWVPKAKNENLQKRIIQLILFIVNSGCTKHMTGNLKLLCNFVEKFLGTVRFGNDQFAPITGYGDLVQGNITINRVYYVEGLNHNLFSVGQFCDADLEVAFRKYTCFVRDLQGNDLLTTDAHVPSQQELDLLFGPLYDEFFTAGTLSVNKSSSLTNNSNLQDTQPTMNIQPTSEPSSPTYVHAKKNTYKKMNLPILFVNLIRSLSTPFRS